MAHNLSKIGSLLKKPKARAIIEAGRKRRKKEYDEKRATIREDARNPLKKKSPTKPVVRAPKPKAKVKAKTVRSPHTTTSKASPWFKDMAREKRDSLRKNTRQLKGRR